MKIRQFLWTPCIRPCNLLRATVEKTARNPAVTGVPSVITTGNRPSINSRLIIVYYFCNSIDRRLRITDKSGLNVSKGKAHLKPKVTKIAKLELW